MRILLAVALLPTVASAAPYDKMFEVGTTMTYEDSSSRRWGGEKPTTTSTRASCKVTAVTKIGGARVSTIECDAQAAVAGHWMATTRGMWRLSNNRASDVKEARGTAPMIAARPRVGTRKKLDEYELGESVTITNQSGRWCVDEEYSDVGGGSSSRACFENGLLAEWESGGYYWSEGGGENTSKSVLVPQSLPKPTVSPAPPLKNTSP